MTPEQRLDRLDTMIAQDRILRGKWTDTDAAGRELACLLAALAPEAAESRNPRNCPAEVMPEWLACLTPLLDDYVSEDYWLPMLQRYAKLARRWHVLDDAAWRRAEYRVRVACVREAMAHTHNVQVFECCQHVIALCERVGAGGDPSDSEWVAAQARVRALAIWTPMSPDGSVARAAGAAAGVVSGVDSWNLTARAAGFAAAGAAEAVGAAQWAPALDRLAAATLDAIETECEAMEKTRD